MAARARNTSYNKSFGRFAGTFFHRPRIYRPRNILAYVLRLTKSIYCGRGAVARIKKISLRQINKKLAANAYCYYVSTTRVGLSRGTIQPNTGSDYNEIIRTIFFYGT